MIPKAIVSDIHANIEAFTVVMRHLEEQQIEFHEIYCLGDIIGYGPNPVECIDIAMQFPMALIGNHEEAVINGAFGFNPIAKRAIDWTRLQLKPGVFSSGMKKSRWEYLRSLRLSHREDGLEYYHGSPRDPTMEYILKVDTDDYFGEIPPKIREIFGMISGPCFVGHSHVPCLITEDNKYFDIRDLNYEYRMEPGAKYIVNTGSVGQPRDQDSRACYITLHPEDDGHILIRWHRLEYDHPATAEKIRAIPELDNKNADRLAKGM